MSASDCPVQVKMKARWQVGVQELGKHAAPCLILFFIFGGMTLRLRKDPTHHGSRHSQSRRKTEPYSLPGKISEAPMAPQAGSGESNVIAHGEINASLCSVLKNETAPFPPEWAV